VVPVRISAKIEYACIAMAQLAAGYGTGRPIRIRRISQDNGIPSRFLVQILLQLKGAGLVRSVRGAAGGYYLAQPPSEISLAAVLDVINGGDSLASSVTVPSSAANVLMGIWHEVGQRERDMLESITLADVLERIEARSPPMFYI
jgi:Rrf2 family protein